MTSTSTTTELLGNQIRARRKQLGLTLRDVADLAGVAVTFVHQLEHGKPTVRLSKVIDVLTVLGLKIELKDRLR
ncbi:MAG: type II toxin-antitoxin system Y4mF family antitoxin [Solirubrobacterales bacterium]